MGAGFHSCVSGIGVLCLLAGPVGAAEPFKDFTFKSVKPPAAGASKRINIQVTPEPAAPIQSVSPVRAVLPDQQNWFWDVISPSLDAASPGRFQDATVAIAKAPAGTVDTASLAQLKKVADTYRKEILLATIGTRISPALVLALIGTESGGDAKAQSQAGAAGLMQLMPAAAARFNVTDPFDPAQNIAAGVAYLDWLLDKFKGDPILALAAYNAGENAVLDAGGVPAFNETRAYVPKVIASFQVAKALCLTPPELFSDGCVLAMKEP